MGDPQPLIYKKPNTKESIYGWVKAMLGGPRRTLETDDDTLDYFLENSLEEFSRYLPKLRWFSMPGYAGKQDYVPEPHKLGYGIVDVMIPRIDPLAPMLLSCFTEDTSISLLDGRERTLRELYDEYGSGEFWVYSCSPDGRIHPGRAHDLQRTKRNVEVVEVEISNGHKVRCTLDHKWMLRDGTYREAGELQPGDSLMPLYRRFSTKEEHGREGYELFLEPKTGKWKYTHQRVARDVHGAPSDYKTSRGAESWIIHHGTWDPVTGAFTVGSKTDNSPAQLCWMRSAAHGMQHGLHWEQTLGKWIAEHPEEVARNTETWRAAAREFWASPEGKKRAAENGRAVLQQQWQEKPSEMLARSMAALAKVDREGPAFQEHIARMCERNCLPHRRAKSSETFSRTWEEQRGALAKSISDGRKRRFAEDREFAERQARVAAENGRKHIKKATQVRLSRQINEVLGLVEGPITEESYNAARDLYAARKGLKVNTSPTYERALRFMHPDLFPEKEHQVSSEPRILGKVRSQVRKVLSFVDGSITEESYNAARERYMDSLELKTRNYPTYEKAVAYLGDLDSVNHNVVSVRPAGRADVWCFMVDKHGNYALTAGSIVKNSGPRLDIFAFRFSYAFRDIRELYIDQWYYAEAQRQLSSEFQWRWIDGRIVIHPKPDEPFPLTYCAAHLHDIESVPLDDLDWIKKYTLGQAEVSVGRVRGKFNVPGQQTGQTTDGGKMEDTGHARMEKLEEELINRSKGTLHPIRS